MLSHITFMYIVDVSRSSLYPFPTHFPAPFKRRTHSIYIDSQASIQYSTRKRLIKDKNHRATLYSLYHHIILCHKIQHSFFIMIINVIV